MAFIFRTTVVVLVLTSRLTQGASAANRRAESFTPSACFEDLCMSRDWYCSNSEQRCKPCLPDHCIDNSRTPAQCLPLCPELLPVTKAAIPEGSRTTTAGPSERAPQAAAGTTPLPGAGRLSGLNLPLSLEMMLIVALFVIVLLVLVLVAVVLCYVRTIHKRQVQTKEKMSVEETSLASQPADSGVGLGSPSNGNGESSNSSSIGLNSEPESSLERPHDAIASPTRPPALVQPALSGPSGQDRILTSNGGRYPSGLPSSANRLLLSPAVPDDGSEEGSCSFPLIMSSSHRRAQPEARGLAEIAGSRELVDSWSASPVSGTALPAAPCHQRLNEGRYSPLRSYDDQDATRLKISI